MYDRKFVVSLLEVWTKPRIWFIGSQLHVCFS